MINKINLLSKEKTTRQNRIWVRIASACNNKCIFCLDDEAQNGTFPKEEDVKKQIKNGFVAGTENRIIISGGEASINPKFPEYIRYAKEIGYDRVQTVTNGNMFTSDVFCKKVFEAGLEEVTFSFHGHNSTLHDYLVATPNAFRKSLKGLIYIKKYFPNIIINIDIVVNKMNVKYLPDIVKFFMKLGVYEYDILQIIPFGRGFREYKEQLFYNIQDHIAALHETWKLSKLPHMYIWTNRFPAEAFEGYEDLIQDPRKIKSEVMWESREMFEPFILSKGKDKPECYGDACDVCYQKQYCHDFIDNQNVKNIKQSTNNCIVSGREFPSDVYSDYGENIGEFTNFLEQQQQTGNLINIPKCLGGSGIYQTYNDLKQDETIEEYTKEYTKNLHKVKSLKCNGCIHNDSCKGIHINFVRSYGFSILEPIK